MNAWRLRPDDDGGDLGPADADCDPFRGGDACHGTETVGFEVVNGYTGKEALPLMSIHPKYLAFVSLMLPDMSAFELLEKFRLYHTVVTLRVFAAEG